MRRPARLVGRDVERAQHLAVPRGLGIELEPERRAGVARQHRLVAVPHGLEPEVVVRPAVGQEEPLAIGDLVEEIRALDPLECRRFHLDDDRRQERGNALDAVTASATGNAGFRIRPIR